MATLHFIVGAAVGQMKAEMQSHVQTELQKALSPIHDDLSRLRKLPGTATLLGSVFGAVITGIGIVLAILSFAGDRFDGGMATGSVVSQATAQRDAEQANTIAQINAKLDALGAKGSNDADQSEKGTGRKPHR